MKEKIVKRFIYLTLIIIAVSNTVPAMDFTWSGINGVKLMLEMKGEVKKGDYEKFRKFMLDNLDEYSGTRMISLSSNGGDLVETLKIAKILKAMYPSVSLGDSCASSCFFLYLTGINRTHGKLGVHRPYFDATYFSGLPIKDAEAAHAELTKIVNAYLEANAVPHYLIEIMNRTSSTEIYWLNDKEIGDLGERPAWYEEFLTAKCGYDKSVGERYNDKPENRELYKAWLENFIKYQPCEDKFLAEELKKLPALLQVPTPVVKTPSPVVKAPSKKPTRKPGN